MTRLTVDLLNAEAAALAQMCKRLSRGDCERLASRYDGGAEAEQMWAGVLSLQRALNEAGYAPR